MGSSEKDRFDIKGRGIIAYIPVFAAVCVGLALTISVFVFSRQREQTNLQNQLDITAHDYVSMLKRQTQLHILELESTAAFYGGSILVERDEFSEFVKVFLRGHTDVHGICWAPSVSESEVLMSNLRGLPVLWILRSLRNRPAERS